MHMHMHERTCIRRMSRDQRIQDNWALLYACEQAAKSGAPVAICFNLVRLTPRPAARPA